MAAKKETPEAPTTEAPLTDADYEVHWTGQELVRLTEATAATLRCLSDTYAAHGRLEEAAIHLEAAALVQPDDAGLRQQAMQARRAANKA